MYHEGLAEAPWIELDYQSAHGYTPIDKEIRQNSYICLFDEELGRESNGLDTPKLFGQILEFIGFDEVYAIAIIQIFTYYHRPSLQLLSYHTGKHWHYQKRCYEQTIIFLRRPFCKFAPTDLLEYQPGKLTAGRSMVLHSNKTIVIWGPRRPWREQRDWVHPVNRYDEDKEAENRKHWEEEEECGRGEFF